MSPIAVVCRKEILDNARDRRTIFSTLLFGPLFAPLMFAVMINMMVGRAISTAEEELAIPILGSERASSSSTPSSQRPCSRSCRSSSSA